MKEENELRKNTALRIPLPYRKGILKILPAK